MAGAIRQSGEVSKGYEVNSIVIYTNPDILKEKTSIDFDEYYWTMDRFPKRLEEGDRVYFAVKGFVVGSFKVHRIDWEDPEDRRYGADIIWTPKSWRKLKKPIPCKPFRGFRYFTTILEILLEEKRG